MVVRQKVSKQKETGKEINTQTEGKIIERKAEGLLE